MNIIPGETNDEKRWRGRSEKKTEETELAVNLAAFLHMQTFTSIFTRADVRLSRVPSAHSVAANGRAGTGARVKLSAAVVKTLMEVISDTAAIQAALDSSTSAHGLLPLPQVNLDVTGVRASLGSADTSNVI